MALSNFLYGAVRAWEIKNLSKNEISLAMFVASALNSSFFIFSMKRTINGTWAHEIAFVLSSALAPIFATYVLSAFQRWKESRIQN